VPEWREHSLVSISSVIAYSESLVEYELSPESDARLVDDFLI
jgi:hypothetical protein